MSRKAVFILGAGAALPWGAPKTVELTNLLLADTRFVTRSGVSLAQYIYDQLRDYFQGDPDSVNFETIIHAMEIIGDHLREKTATGAGALFISQQPLWLTEAADKLEEMWNFDFKVYPEDAGYSGLEKKGTITNKVTGEKTEGYPECRKELVYLQSAIKHYLFLIRNEIERYSLDVKTKFKALNSQLIQMMTALKNAGYTLRVYTANYDRLFPEIFNDATDISFTDGFERELSDEATPEFEPDLKKILGDDACDCYYNLHGSIFWKYEMSHQDFDHCYSCTPEIANTRSVFSISQNVNPGENRIVYNIVTGYNKVQRTSLEPMHAFHSRLELDAINADMLITIGYSFSDFHINTPLRNAVRNNPKLKLAHITWNPANDFLTDCREGTFWRNYILGNSQDGFDVQTKHDGEWIHSGKGDQHVYKGGFKSFLENNEWEKLL